MMLMSVYRQRQAVIQMDHAACLSSAATPEDIDLIGQCMKWGRPTLVGMDGRSSIIKPAAPGDEGLSFEALYDDCLTLSDLQKMRKAQVSNPDDMPLEIFRITMEAELVLNLTLAVAVRAKNNGAARPVFRKLLEEDPMFREAFTAAIVEAATKEMENTTDFPVRTADVTSIDYDGTDLVMPPDRQWQIIDPD